MKYLLLIVLSMATIITHAKIILKDTSEIIISSDEKALESSDFEFLIQHVSTGTHQFSLNENNNAKKLIGLIGSLDYSENNFKLTAEEIPSIVVSSIPEPKLISMIVLGIIMILTISKRKLRI